MQLELKAVKVLRQASEETLCFEATVYVDGERAFVATNDGRGGCNHYHGEQAKIRAAEEWAKAQPDAPEWEALDYYVGRLLDQHEAQRSAARILSRNVVLALGEPGSNMRQVRGKLTDALRQHLLGRYPYGRILNEMPLAEATPYLVEVR